MIFKGKVPLLLLCFFMLPFLAMARICTSVGNGNWNNATTWSCPGTPLPGDTVIIQEGHTVIQSNNQTYSGAPILVHVYGTWQFSGGGSKITLPCGSYIEIFPGGSLHPDPSYQGFSETVRICNITYWNTTMGSQEGYVIWPPPPAGLPVELISFEALDQEQEVHLHWTTATERNISHFVVHRSTATLEKSIVGSIPASGNSSVTQHYMMRDAPRHSGEYYYHLDEVSSEGQTMEIAIAATRFAKREEMLRCVPNPLTAMEALNVELPEHGQGLDVLLVGNEGRWMRPSSLDLDGTLVVIMDGLQLSSGIYTLQVIEGGDLLGTCRFRLE